MRSQIVGTGSYAPEKVLTNADLEKLVETNDDWIVERTGIRERHVAGPEEATSDLAYAAAMRALEMAKVEPAEIELIAMGSPFILCMKNNFPSLGLVTTTSSPLKVVMML